MFEIREIKVSEYDFLSEMLREAVFFPDPAKKQEKMLELEPVFANYFDDFGRAGDIAFVLDTDDGLSGAVWTRLYTEQTRSYGFVDDKTPELGIAIKQEYRDQGYGAAMINKILERLRREGFETVSLSVDKRNPAVKLYERMGFQVHSEGGSSCTMVRSIEES